MRKLLPNKIYITPSGRLCKLVPNPKHGPGSDGSILTFAYLTRSGGPSKDDGFSINVENEVTLKLFAELGGMP